MKMTLSPSKLSGAVVAIPSKSYAHRLLLAAALADGPTQIFCPVRSQDIDATVGCLKTLGCEISYQNSYFYLTPPEKYNQNMIFDCVECGTLLRFFLPILTALGSGGILTGQGRLPTRPLSPLYEELEAHGAVLTPELDAQILPLAVSGQLKSGDFTLAANISSQFIGGLLMALPLLDGDSKLTLMGNIESRPYIDMTLDVLKLFQIQITQSADGREFFIPGDQIYRSPKKTFVEGDWSNAAFWLCAGALGHPVQLSNLNFNSRQGDKQILDVLKNFGAEIITQGDKVVVSAKNLVGQNIDCSQIPDLVPILAVTACFAQGETCFYNAQRLRLKESDRIQTVCALISTLGGQIQETADGMIVTGSGLSGGQVDSFNDHRIAMSAAIAALGCLTPVALTGGEAVDKSYPDFYADYAKLGGIVQTN